MATFLFILGIVLFICLVLVHEYGHFIVARRNGVEVEEFGLFFPPRAKVLTKRKGTEYTLNWLPLGGFVKLKGESDADTEPGSFGAASTWVKTKIMLAGVAMNLVTAFILLTMLALVGLPRLVDNPFTVHGDTKIIGQAKSTVVIASLVKGGPADKAGLKQGDRLLRYGSMTCEIVLDDYVKNRPVCDSIKSYQALNEATKIFEGTPFNIEYERDDRKKVATVELRSTEEVEASKKTDKPIGYLGVGLGEQRTSLASQRSTWSAPIVAAGTMTQFTGLTFQGLGTALEGVGSILAGFVTGNDDARRAGQTEASSQVSGPIGIFVVLESGTEQGLPFILFIIAVISLSLAIMNALPIPALDGGRLFVLLVSRALRRPLTREAEEAIHGTGFPVLIGLIILISIVDVRRFF